MTKFGEADANIINPPKLCGLHYAKGQLKEEMVADLVMWDPEATFKIFSLVTLYQNLIFKFKNSVSAHVYV
jgi:dihydroorotase-like cyclic amidohydrolase